MDEVVVVVLVECKVIVYWYMFFFNPKYNPVSCRYWSMLDSPTEAVIKEIENNRQ